MINRWINAGRYQFDDKKRASPSDSHPRIRKNSYCQWLRNVHSGCQPGIKAIRPNAKNDEESLQKGWPSKMMRGVKGMQGFMPGGGWSMVVSNKNT